MRHPEALVGDPDHVATVVDTLTSADLAPIVDLVITADRDGYEARAVDGSVRFRRRDEGHGWAFDVVATDGRNPLGDQSTDRFVGREAEQAGRWPDRGANAYPHAYEMVAQVFDHPAAPDAIVLHTPAHNWEDQGGHRGEHGSMGVVQARAPFLIGGAGVKRHGLVDRSCKLVDVAPTVLALMGAAPHPTGRGLNGAARPDALLARQDGEVLDDLLDPTEEPDHVVGFLLDGCNPNVLHDAIAAGEAPNLARILELGTSFRHGAFASAPTVTLANHTGILTGAHPGHHGILNNAWYDRAAGRQVITNSPETWITSMASLSPDVETIFHAVARTWPDAVTLAANEPCDTGATVGTFGLIRGGTMPDRPPATADLPFATERFVRPEKQYRSASKIDHVGLELALGVWGDGYQGTTYPLPKFSWVNFSLTDAAFHLGGPWSDVARASIHDTDARIGEVLDAVERAGAFDRTAFFAVADHGMEESNPAVTGDWGEALAATGVPHRDEAYMWIYTDVEAGGRTKLFDL